MADRFDDLEELFDRHARRLARDLGGLIVEVGEALRRAAEPENSAPPPPSTASKAEPTRDDLYREATRLGVPGRSKMTKEQLRTAVKRAKTSR
jgi:hypothetical protein